VVEPVTSSVPPPLKKLSPPVPRPPLLLTESVPPLVIDVPPL
jgi:hypothetical protein